VSDVSADQQQCHKGAILGAGEDLRVVLMTRGGGQIVSELNPDNGSFTRKLDETSTLTLAGTVTGKLDTLCCDEYTDAHQWALEVAVFRDGRDAWVGPVTEIDFMYGRVELNASDLSAWWDRRVLPDMNLVSMDLADIFQAIHDAAMASDPSPNFTIQTSPTGIFGDRRVIGSDFDYAVDHLSELAKTGVDWTAYGRNVMVGGQEVPAFPYVTLLDEHWTEPPTVEARGNDQATRVIVKGTGVSADVTDAAYRNFYGELVRVFKEEDIIDVESAQQAAQSRLDLLKNPLFIVTPENQSLKTTAPITLPELIPGMRIRVDAQATCRPIVQDFRLQSVEVNFDGKVAITLQPLGTVDLNALSESEIVTGE
jgi:hypothetical protein